MRNTERLKDNKHGKQFYLKLFESVIDRFYKNYNLIQEKWRFMDDKERKKALRESDRVDAEIERLEKNIKIKYGIDFNHCNSYREMPVHLKDMLNYQTKKEGVAINA